ncbi:hypothetical protein B0H14DRAFT_2355073, partial [Mycena olivaceomarginata]
AFHLLKPLLAAALHNDSIQLWNYCMGVLVDRFEEHEGERTGVNFHLSRTLLTTGGDDYENKVWGQSVCFVFFALHGHLDYVQPSNSIMRCRGL